MAFRPGPRGGIATGSYPVARPGFCEQCVDRGFYPLTATHADHIRPCPAVLMADAAMVAIGLVATLIWIGNTP